MSKESTNAVERIDELFSSATDPKLPEGKRMVAKVRLLEFLLDVAAQIEERRETSSSVLVTAREAECRWMWDWIMEMTPGVWARLRAEMQLEGDFRRELAEYKRHRVATAQWKGSRAVPDRPSEPRRVMMASTTGRH